MVASLRTPADIVNAALVSIGRTDLVGTLYDGSLPSRQALSIYGQVRDELLRSSDWGFAERTNVLDLRKTAPANYVPPNTWNPNDYPPLPWKFEYAYPDDCLQVRSLRPVPLFTGPNFDPSPVIFKVVNDQATNPLPTRAIVSNTPDAICVYTGRITDPSTFSVDFTALFVDEMGKHLSASLATLNNAQMQAAEGAEDRQRATKEQG